MELEAEREETHMLYDENKLQRVRPALWVVPRFHRCLNLPHGRVPRLV
jgi:hypothetical protein